LLTFGFRERLFSYFRFALMERFLSISRKSAYWRNVSGYYKSSVNMQKLLKIILILICIIFFGCESKTNKIIGIWIPNIPSVYPTLEIDKDKIIIANENNIRQFKYKIIDNEIILLDSIGEWYGWHFNKNVDKYNYKIEKVTNDSLALSFISLGSKYEYGLSRNAKKSDHFIKITLYQTNGWNSGVKIEIDSMGETNVWVENVWKKTKRFGHFKMPKEKFNRILTYSNNLYDYKKLDKHGSCADCLNYSLYLYRKDSMKSFHFDESSMLSFVNMITGIYSFNAFKCN